MTPQQRSPPLKDKLPGSNGVRHRWVLLYMYMDGGTPLIMPPLK